MKIIKSHQNKMVSSSMQKFRDNTVSSCTSTIAKKRRKKRKYVKRNNNSKGSFLPLSPTSTGEVLRHEDLTKTKPYFQHDNRWGQKNTKIKKKNSISSHLSSILKKYTAEEVCYKEVAKKFKPLNTSAKRKPSKHSTNNFFNRHSQGNTLKVKKKKTKQKLNKASSVKRLVANFRDNITIKKFPTLTCTELQFCVCPCQIKRHKSNTKDNSNNKEFPTAIISNINNKLSSCISGANTVSKKCLINCQNHTATTQNELTVILKPLEKHTPNMFLESFENNAKLLKYVEECKRVRDSHQILHAQQEKNAPLRESINISDYFAEGLSFNSAKKYLPRSLALQELDTERGKTAAEAAKEKSTCKHYALEITPSKERDMSSSVVTADNDNIIKKKKKKKASESLLSPEQRKGKKKSKKRKKESKAKKAKKLRKRKVSYSDSNGDNYKESLDEDSKSEIDDDVKKSRKKTKRVKKKRKNKKKQLSSLSDKSRSTSPIHQPIESIKNETIMEFHCHSKVTAHEHKEPQRHSYESQYRSRRRSHGRNDGKRTKLHGSSRNVTKESICSKDYPSNEINIIANYNNKDSESRRSGSQLELNSETSNENIKKLTHTRYDEYLQTKSGSPNSDKCERYSCSFTQSLTSNNQDKMFSAETKSTFFKERSRSPMYKFIDSQAEVNKCRSTSPSIKENWQKSCTPPPRTFKNFHLKTYDTFNNQKKEDKRKKISDKNLPSLKSRSRNTSMSTSNSSFTGNSKSMTPSPKRECLEETYLCNRIHKQKPIIKFTTPTPTSAKRSSISIHVSLNDRNKKDKYHFGSRPKEQVEMCPSIADKKALSPRSSHGSSALVYGADLRYPDRYDDIMENTKCIKADKFKTSSKEDVKELIRTLKQSDEREWERKEKTNKSDRNQAKPVVRLHSQSDEDIDVVERNNEKILDEFQEFKRERDLKDIKMLEELKTGIAAKAKQKIKTIEKMAASTSANSKSNNSTQLNDKFLKCTVRNSLNDFLVANNVAPAMVTTCSPVDYNTVPYSPPTTIYPQTFEEIKKEQESVLQLAKISSQMANKNNNKDNAMQIVCKKPVVTNSRALLLSPTSVPLFSNKSCQLNKERDRKRERVRDTNYFGKDHYLERKQKSSPNFYSSGGAGSGSASCVGSVVGGRRNINSNMLNINHRPQRPNLMYNFSCIATHNHHSHLHTHHHQSNHKIINNHIGSTPSSSNNYIANGSSTNPHTIICNHGNNSNISFNRPSRINNTPLITATQFNNQMLCKQSNSILVNRRDHRTALNLGLSGTPCTNFSNSNLLLTKVNINPHHVHATAVGHAMGSGHNHQYYHQNPNTSMSSAGSIPANQLTDHILMAASMAAARQGLGVHNAASTATAVTAASNLNFFHQQNKQKVVIKPFKINDSQPLVDALADSSLVDAIVSKVSTATVAAAESAARRSRSRSRRSQSRDRHQEKTSRGTHNSRRGVEERNGNRHRSTSYSMSSSSTSSHSRTRSLQSHSSQSSSSTHTSSRSSSSSSFGTPRSGSRSPSIPRRRGSPSFLDRRRITSARKRPIPYHRKFPSDVSSCYCSSCCSHENSPVSRTVSQDSRSPSRYF